jgi:hypothetical protein
MNELLAKIIVIDAHGGMERWNGHEKVDAMVFSRLRLSVAPIRAAPIAGRSWKC